MNANKRKQLLKAVLACDKKTVDRLTKESAMYFQSNGKYFKNSFELSISKEQFETEFRLGVDRLIGFTDQIEQRKRMREFGLNKNEIDEYMAEQTSDEETMKLLLKLKTKLENE